MNRIPAPSKTPATEASNSRRTAGPTPLTASDLARVSGGLPRAGGWSTPTDPSASSQSGTPTAAATGTDLPRAGGW